MLTGDQNIADVAFTVLYRIKDAGNFLFKLRNPELTVKDMAEMKRVFRLHPPRGPKGWGGLKRSYVVGGARGPRGEEMTALVERMI